MKVSYLPDAEDHPLWPQMLRLLEFAAAHGGLEAKDDNDLVWIAFDGPTLFGVATTCVWNDGEAEIRNIAGFKFEDWGRDMEATLVRWARDCGATRLTARGRKGWSRYARKIGRGLGWASVGEDEDGLLLFEKEL